MMKKIMMIVFILSFFCCSSKFTKINYSDAILAIETRTGELVTSASLFEDSTFLSIFEHPNEYKEDALNFLFDIRFTEQQKMISVFSMQDLDTKNYIDYASRSFALFQKDKISANVLLIVINSDINSDNLRNTHSNTKFLSILKSISESPKSSINLKGVCNAILKRY